VSDLIEVAPYQEADDREPDHDDACEPGACGDLGDGGDEEHDRRGDAAHGVEGDARAPPWAPQPPPVDDHPGLGEREGEEHAHGEERDQRCRVPTEGDEHDRGEQRQGDDAVVEGEAIAHPEHRKGDGLAHPLPHDCAAPEGRAEQQPADAHANASQVQAGTVTASRLELVGGPAGWPHMDEATPAGRLGQLGRAVQRRVNGK
jgi:hypothetical protein